MLFLVFMGLLVFAFAKGLFRGWKGAPKTEPGTYTFPTDEEVTENRRKLWQEARAILAQDAAALALKRRQKVYQDAYGENRQAWDLEIKTYLTRRPRLLEIGGLLESFGENYYAYKDVPMVKLIDQTALSAQSKSVHGSPQASLSQQNPIPGASAKQPTNDPWEFERQCAETLEQAGWSTQLTAKTGDQGIDVIATKSGAKCVVQCKLYTKPVGNSAVQEIRAGRDHEQADYAVVVSTSGFTKSAYALASSTQVLLLDFSELHNLDEQIAKM